MSSSTTRRIMKAATLALLATSMTMLAGLLSAPSAEAQQVPAGFNPCPQFSIQNVFDDPNSDWDRDRVQNAVELNNGLKPCEADGEQFCLNAPSLCLKKYTVAFSCNGAVAWTWAHVTAEPNADWDRDGVSNIIEARNGANPCAHPCPYPTQIDLLLNPNGSWDNDGVSNSVEVSRGQNPCTTNVYPITYQPCPNWTTADVAAQPNADWDRDGVSNRDEFYRGTSPCQAPIVIVNQPVIPPRYVVVTPTYAPAARFVPYVVQPPAGRSCSARYPYYNPATLQCGTRPVVTRIY